MKRLAPVLAYAAVAIGLFGGRSAWGALIGFHLAMLFALWLDRRNLPPPSLLFKSKHRRWIVSSLLVGSASGISLYLLWPWLGIAPDLAAQLDALGLTRAAWPAFIAYFTLVNPWIEEYFWRGYLADNSRQPAPMDFIFAGYHAMLLIGRTNLPALALSLSVLVFGAWFWRQTSRKDDGLLAAALGHLIADLTILLAVYRMVA
ncbi:MAG: CPBP family intramembrane metalloprotease [Chloroflexi bacterium]|nr:CPBP family intramembrane metalloprotease [Chloroflexota bacterium]